MLSPKMSDVEADQERAAGSGEEETKTNPGSPGQSKALKDIVDFNEDDQDLNTELFRSTIRTTPLDSDKEPFGVYDLVESPDSQKDTKEEESLARKTVEKEALEAARDSGGESEEELEGYSGDTSKREDEDWTIVRCSSVDAEYSTLGTEEDTNPNKGGEEEERSRGKEGSVKWDIKYSETEEEGVVDTDGKSPQSPAEVNGNDKDFEIIDAEMIEEIAEGGKREAEDIKSGGEAEPEGEEQDAKEEGDGGGYEEIGAGEESRTSDEGKGVDSGVVEVDVDKEKEDGQEEEGEVDEEGEGDDDDYVQLMAGAGMEDPGDRRGTPLSRTEKKAMDVDEAEDKMDVQEDGEAEKPEGDRDEDTKTEGDKQEDEETEGHEDEKDPTEDITDLGDEEKEVRSTSDFDDLEVGTRLDTHLQKSRARLGKTGALAQRRKPPRSSWYVEEGQDLDKFKFTDSTRKAIQDISEPKPLRKIEEETTRSHPVPASRTPPKPASRRPPGAMGGPLLIPGLGQIGMVKLKKTKNLEPGAAKSSPPSTAKPPAKSPLGRKVFPMPTTRSAAHSKGKAPPAPKAKTPLSPIESRDTTTTKPAVPSKETKPLSPMEKSSPTSLKGGVGFRLPPPGEGKPALKPRNKPLPKPRPQSIAASSSPSKDDPLSSVDDNSRKTSKDDLNSQMLNNRSNATGKETKTPLWSADKHKRLPPISPTNKESSPAVPRWKQELLKKKKEAETLEHQSEGAEDSSVKKSVIPPPLHKSKDESDPPGRAPFTTVPQWQLDLAEKNRKKKEHDEVDLGSRPAKERKTEDSNKIEAKKPPLTPKPAIIPRKKFDAIPPEKDTVPSWQRNLQERRKKNEKNLLIETNGEKQDTEKPAEMASPTKKELPIIKSPSYHHRTSVPLWQLELERMRSPLAQRFNRSDED